MWTRTRTLTLGIVVTHAALCSLVHGFNCDDTINSSTTFTSDFQDLLDNWASSEHYTVCVAPGTYSGCQSATDFETAGGGTVELVGLGWPSINCLDKDFAIIDNAPDVTIRNLSIFDGDRDFFLSPASILLVEDTRVLLHSVLIYDSESSFIFLEGSTHFTAVNCSFFDSKSVGLTAHFYNLEGYLGGAIASDAGPITLTNCVFEDNVAVEYGGAVYSDRDALSVVDCVFKDNSADAQGGAIYVTSNQWGDVLVDGCLFEANRGEDGGGALSFRGDSDLYTVVNSVFVDNIEETSGGVGGGAVRVNIDSGESVVVDNCLFEGNDAASTGGTDGGGALFVEDARVTVTNCVFKGNTADYGSSLVLAYAESDALVSNCTSEDGYAESYGTLRVLYGEPALFQNISSRNNYVGSGGSVIHIAYAGATVANSVSLGDIIGPSAVTGGISGLSCTITVRNSIFEGSYSSSAFAGPVASFVFDRSIDFVMTDCVVASTSFGLDSTGVYGAVKLWDDHTAVLTRVMFVDCSGSYGASAVASIGTLTVADCEFTDCTSDRAGAVLIAGGTATVSGSTFSGGQCDSGCGLAAEEDAVVEVTANTFRANSAFSSGGAVAVADSANVFVTHNNFTVNGAAGAGGALAGGESAQLASSDNEFAANSARSGGALACADDAVCNSDSDTFNNNYARDGGAVVVKNIGSATLTNALMDGNSAEDYGGAVCAQDGTATVAADSVLVGNTAAYGGTFATTGGDLRVTSSVNVYDTAAVLGGLALSTQASTLSLNNTVTNCTADSLGAVLFMLEGKSCYLNVRMSGVASNTQYVFALLTQSLSVVRATMEFWTGEGIQARGVGHLSVVDSTILTHGAGQPVAVYGVGEAVFQNSYVASDGQRGALVCQTSGVVVDGSVFCSNAGAVSECDGSCSVSGDLTSCPSSSSGNCYEACDAADFCVPAVSGSDTVPNLGCNVCGGVCEDGTDACNTTSTVCGDATGGPGYECVCVTGYEGLAGNGLSCGDYDECSAGTDACVAPAYCVNSVGSYTCDCPAGYVKSGSRSCGDVNECVLGTPCGTGINCINTFGSFVCDCPPDNYVFTGSNGCEPCPPGWYTIGGVVCAPCAANSWSNTTNAEECSPCPEFSGSVAGSVECECDAGFANVGGICTAVCGFGEYLVGTEICIPCRVGAYGSAAGVCTDCPAFRTTNQTGAVGLGSCVCIDGFEESGGLGECLRVCGPGEYSSVAVSECLDCPDGSYKANTGIATNCTACPASGMTTGGSGAVNGSTCACPSGYSAEAGVCALVCGAGLRRPTVTSECEVCPPGRYNGDVNVAECRICPANTVSPAGSTVVEDCTCRAGYFNGDGEVGKGCTACPAGSVCAGGTAQPEALPGYAPGAEGFVECSPEEACSGGGKCSEGYTGSRCAACEEGYHRINGYCRPCGGGTTTAFVFALLASVVGCAGLVAFNWGGSSLARAASVAVALNALQIVGLYGRLGINWPTYIQRLYDVMGLFSMNVELVGPECLFGGDAYATRFVLVAVYPLVLGAVFLVILGLLEAGVSSGLIGDDGCCGGWCCGSDSGGDGDDDGAGSVASDATGRTAATTATGVSSTSTVSARRELRRSVLLSYLQVNYVVYLPVVAVMVEYFKCVDVGDGSRVVASSPEVVCGEGVWSSLLPLAVLGVAVYGVGFPLGLAGSLAVARVKSGLNSSGFVLRWGYLFNRYRSEVFWYEGVVLARKFGVVLLMAFVTQSANIQAGATVMWIQAAVVVNAFTRPYAAVIPNVMEAGALTMVCVVLEAGLVFQDSSMSDAAKGGIMIVLILALVCGLVFCIVKEFKTDRAELRRSTHQTSTFGEMQTVVEDEISDPAIASGVLDTVRTDASNGSGVGFETVQTASFGLAASFNPAYTTDAASSSALSSRGSSGGGDGGMGSVSVSGVSGVSGTSVDVPLPPPLPSGVAFESEVGYE